MFEIIEDYREEGISIFRYTQSVDVCVSVKIVLATADSKSNTRKFKKKECFQFL